MKKETPPPAGDFQNVVHLMALFTEVTNRLDGLQNRVNEHVMELLDSEKEEYSQLQDTLKATEAALEAAARQHPEWFTKKKSLKTPFGEVKFHAGTKLAISNEELTLHLIKEAITKDPALAGLELVRSHEEPNKEALEKLDDGLLKRFRIDRVVDDHFSVKAAKLDMGKAVSELPDHTQSLPA